MFLLILLLGLTKLSLQFETFTFYNSSGTMIQLTNFEASDTSTDKFNSTYSITTSSTFTMTDNAKNEVLCLNTNSSSFSLVANTAITDGFYLVLQCSGAGNNCTSSAGTVTFTLSDVVDVTYISDTSLTVGTAHTLVSTAVNTVSFAGAVGGASFSVANSTTTDFYSQEKKYLA
mmetsp:Transcript_241/g.279  ORF Transcript_241/g.279 Transcript_241/m.279 type:complete len:174 (-) Transcript_241:187-708(-)